MRQLKWLSLLGLLLLGPSAYAQSVRYQSQAISSRGAGIANATIAVCTQPSNTNTQPCSPLATLATSTSTTSGGANPLTADSFGNFFFYAAPGRYTVQIYGPAVFGQLVVPDVEVSSTSGTTAGTFKSISTVLYIDPGNPQGWAGTDVGGWINSAIAALPANGGKIKLGAGSYNFSTQINITSPNVTIDGAGSGRNVGSFTGNQASTILTWTGGASQVILINAPHLLLRGFQLNNTGTATTGIFINGQQFLTFDDLSIDHPTTPFTTACVATSTAGTNNFDIYFIRSSFQTCAPIGVTLDQGILITFDKTTVSHNTGTANIRIGGTSLVTGLYILEGNDIELTEAGTSATGVDIDFVRVTTAVVESNFLETIKAGQFIIRVAAANCTGISIDRNFVQGNTTTNFAIQYNGGTGIFMHENYFTGFVTNAINNVGVTSLDSFNNVYNSANPVYDSKTNIGLIPDANQLSLGSSAFTWIASLYQAQMFRSGGNPGFPDIQGNGSQPVVVGDSHGVMLGTTSALLTGGSTIVQAGDTVYGTYRVTVDQTITAGAGLANIPGLSWTMPASTALTVAFHCEGSYNETTAATSMQFGIQDVTVAPTNIYTKKVAWTSTTAATADNTPTLTTTTATSIGAAFTPSAATTVFNFTLDGMVEQPSNAATSVVNIMAQFTTNNGVIKRGSYCRVW